jgi:hypothetical protein
MNLFEYENSVWGEVWNDKTIKEIQKYEPPEGTGTSINEEPDAYYCWYGTRIPCFFE